MRKCFAPCLNLQNRCHPLNILLTEISSSFSATQIPSCLLTDTLVSSLTHTDTHAVTHTHTLQSLILTCRYPKLSPSLRCSFLCKCFLQTHKDSLPFVNTHTHTLNIACVELTHAVKVILTVCRSFRFHSSKSSSLSTAGSRPREITRA